MTREKLFLIGLLVPVVACQSSDSDGPEGHAGAGGEHSHSLGGAGGSSEHEHEHDPCCELGAMCHSFEQDTDPEILACHELGHRNDQEICAANYDRCAALCSGVTDDPVPHACE